MRLLRLVIATALVAACTLGASLAAPAPADAQLLCGLFNNCPPPPPPPPPQCQDGVDNDADGRIDFGQASTNDPGCASNTDNSEISQCGDGIDNDGDGKKDYGTATTNDPGCAGTWDDDETDPPPVQPACSDGVDNDGDGKTDFGASGDPGCASAQDDDETSQCANGRDDDNDQKIDFGSAAGNDRGCSSRADNDETDPPLPDPACSDGVDNDSDGATDAADPGCAGPSDDSEVSQCADGIDNDFDGKKDFGSAAGNDRGCSSLADNDETDPPLPTPECSDGVDNDADGKEDLTDPGCVDGGDDSEVSQCGDAVDNDQDSKADFGQDPGCSSKADDDETDPPLPDPACSDGVDNDGDAKTDLEDPGCADGQDDSEVSACANGADDDEDGKTDFGSGAANDPGCSSLADDDETDLPRPDPQCSDEVDNDSDGRTDSADPGCAGAQDDDETSQCADGADNDADTKTDFGPGRDPGCASLADHDETDPALPPPACSDGVDNDYDQVADDGDPGCAGASDGDETSRCANGADDDGDGKADFGAGNDPGCSSRADNDEADVAPPPAACADSVDNDADGKSDLADPGCSSAQDGDETSQCADAADNDSDGKADFGAGKDPGCASKADDDETDPPAGTPQCSDGVDNDGDTRTDFGSSGDPGCASATDDSEVSQCADGLDNDQDLKRDFGAAADNDLGCSSRADNDETDPAPVSPQCSDGVDNDADGQPDISDPGCASASDTDETSRCADRIDNDGDGKVDFGAGNDPGCSSRADNDEADAPLPDPQCSDEVDNDADGRTDFGQSGDPGCSSAQDDAETSQCDDDFDNDGDGKADFGSAAQNDPGCSAKFDNDETDLPPATPQCGDGVDNDFDGRTDFGAPGDPGCDSSQDDAETSECADALDNDGDGKTDFGSSGDGGCAGLWDDDETDPPAPPPACADGVDNDVDGRTDAGPSGDPGCADAQDNDETSRCANGNDDDGDGKRDFGAGADPGCSARYDDDETDVPLPKPQCSDGVDNDVDGRTDAGLSGDPGCASLQDDDETSACANSQDDDGDGKVDFQEGDGRDPGCASKFDNDETDPPPPPTPACGDGIDNDGDGKIDFDADPGCTSAQDDDEADPAPTDPPLSEPPGNEPAPDGGTPPQQQQQPQSPGPGGPPAADTPLDEPLPGSALVGVAQRISPPWAGLQLESGLFRNPLTGAESPGGYGPVMIGHALMRQGRRTGDASVTTAGVRAISATVQSSTGIEENPLHLLAIASAYNWARRALAGNADFARARPAWERYLAGWKSTGVGPGAHSCFIDPECFHSYDLVDAVAVLELFATGLAAGAPDAKLADPAARTRAIEVLGRQSYRAIGRSGRALGHGGRLYRLGILSDQPANPLAYHALSIATLARGVELLGAEAPPEALIALKRSIDATSSFAGPDGDVAYIGRAHGAVWALGATVYASQVCARVLPQIARSTAQRCETLALRTLRRIIREYSFGSAGVNAIPRFRTSQIDDRGLDPYANVISSAGLTAVFLEWGAVEEARRGGSAPREPVPLPLDRGGSFHDPTATRFAVMRTRSVWFAVHEHAASLRDPRYDFGLISLKVRRGRGRDWSDVLPPRPLPRPRTGADSAGPVLIRGGRVYYPSGTRTSVNRSAGTVTVHGGWRTSRGRWIRRGVAFRYRAVRNGVQLSFPVEKGDRVAVSDFVPDRARIGRATVRASTFSSKLSPPAMARTSRTSGWSSAYDASLTRIRRTITARRDGNVRWTITAPRGR